MRHTQSTITLPLILSCFFIFSPTESSSAGSLGVSTGFDYSSGDYGETSTTDILYIPFSTKYKNDYGALKLTIPYLHISTEEGTVVSGGGEVIVTDSGDESTETETLSGLGDIILAGTYYLYEGSVNSPWVPMVDLTGKVKFPTADDEKGLGTGEFDYYLHTDLTWVFNKTAIFTTAGYKFVGTPEGYDLNNVTYGSVGLAYQVKRDLSTGVIYDAREATTDSGTGMSEATLYVSHKFYKKFKLLAYGVKGFSDGSADYGIGMTISYAMDIDEIDWMAPIRRFSNR